MFEDEPIPEKKLDLERLSVEDLKERIEDLKAEIAACEAELNKKQVRFDTSSTRPNRFSAN